MVENRRYFLDPDEGLLRALSRLTEIRNQIAWLKRIYGRYNYQGDSDLLAFEREVIRDIRAINNQVDDWEADATSELTRPDLPSLEKGEPVLQFSVSQPESWGGPGGGPIEFMSAGEAIKNQVRITALRLQGGEYVDRIELDYASDKKNWNTGHGGGGGNPQQKLFLEEGQFPTRFEVRAGGFIDRLKVHLSDGRSTEVGGDGGGYNDWSVPADAIVLGLVGRCGEYIDQLQVVHAKLKPASYLQPV